MFPGCPIGWGDTRIATPGRRNGKLLHDRKLLHDHNDRMIHVEQESGVPAW